MAPPSAAAIVAAPVVKLDMTWTQGHAYGVVVVSDLIPASTHMFRVTAHNSLGPSLTSAVSSPVVVKCDRPDQPKITFYHVIPPSAAVLELSVYDCHGAPPKSFELQVRDLVTKPGDVEPAFGEVDAHMYTEWRPVRAKGECAYGDARSSSAVSEGSDRTCGCGCRRLLSLSSVAVTALPLHCHRNDRCRCESLLPWKGVQCVRGCQKMSRDVFRVDPLITAVRRPAVASQSL